MDTLAERWARLRPTLKIIRPEGPGPFPVVLDFPGCGGVRTHLDQYAEAARSVGWMTVRVESFAARGWSEAYTRCVVCRGLRLRGAQRAGDVLAAVAGVRGLDGADPARLALAGWSHGSWAIMDAMTMPLKRRGEAGVADPWTADLSSVRGAWLAYPFIGFPARSRRMDWVRPIPRVLGVATARDHLATLEQYRTAFAHAAASGSRVDLWEPDANHAFDEPGLSHPKIRHDPEMTAEAMRRYAGFLASLI